MLEIKFILLISFCFSQLYETDASINTFEKSIKTYKELWFSNGTPRLLYALCETSSLLNDRGCQVIREKYPHSNVTDSCNVRLGLDQGSRNFGRGSREQVGLIPLGNDHVLLYLIEDSLNPHVKFVTLNIHYCKVRDEKEILALRSGKTVHVAVFDDCYEIHYLKPDDSRVNYTRIAMDFDGNIIDEPLNAEIDRRFPLSRLPLAFPIKMNSRNEGVLSLKTRDDTILPYIDILRPDGTRKHLELQNWPSSSLETTFVNYIGFAVSTAHNVITICSTVMSNELNFKCVQYNGDGNMRFETSLIKDDNPFLLNGGLNTVIDTTI